MNYMYIQSRNRCRCYLSYFSAPLVGLLIGALLLLLSSCKKFVQIGPPSSQLVTTSVFENDYTATSALLNIYSHMVSNRESVYMAIHSGLLSDELKNFSPSTSEIEYYTNALLGIDNSTLTLWMDAYNYIYQSNAILEGMDGNSALDKPVIKQLTGEAEFIRAFWHFYLTTCYGDVPLVTSTAYTVNGTIARTSQQLVYQQVIADLIEAQSKLNPNFVDVTDTTITTSDRGRPTSWAAAALLARVYLYTGDYQNAIAQASAVINKTDLFGLVTPLSSVFLANSEEAIWQLDIPLPTTINTPDGNGFILKSTPVGKSLLNSTALSIQLLGAFEPGDKRDSSWVNSLKVGGVTYYYPFKYQVYSSANVTEDVMVLRLAEQYLIRGEAYAQKNMLSEAIADLNVIRTRAGLPLSTLTASSSQAAVLSAILHERQVELFTEWGHRWFDIVRTNAVDTILGSPGNVCQYKGGNWSTDGHQKLYPIPQNERFYDVNLSQNNGY